MVQEVTPVQAGNVADNAPPLEVLEQQLTLLFFVIVMLIVPRIMVRESSKLDPPAAAGRFLVQVPGLSLAPIWSKAFGFGSWL